MLTPNRKYEVGVSNLVLKIVTHTFHDSTVSKGDEREESQ